MFKLFAIVAFFFCFFAKIQAEMTLDFYCAIGYRDSCTSRFCSLLPDGNGGRKKVCKTVQKSYPNMVLYDGYTSETKTNFKVSWLRVSSACDCTVTLYQGNNAEGPYVKRKLKHVDSTSDQYYVKDLIKETPGSFKIECDFSKVEKWSKIIICLLRMRLFVRNAYNLLNKQFLYIVKKGGLR